MSKTHRFADSVLHSSVSPYLRELFLYTGQEDNYSGAAQYIEKLLRISSNPMQIYREVTKYGAKAGDLLTKETPCVELSEEDVMYAMLDGGMLLTRPSEWKEAKIGRVFKGSEIHSLSKKRSEIRASEYVAHLGNHKDFEAKMNILTDKYAPLNDKLVFINDGARWIWNWIDAEYPKATQILDYYHAKEHLGSFASFYFKDKIERRLWIEETGDVLKKQGIEATIEIIKGLEKKTKTVEEEKKKLLNYCFNNFKRMDYPRYIKQGLLIGSGAIEAAHRTISQKRLKQSGQRWSNKGAQNVLNLRVLNKSGRWNEIRNFLRAA